MMKLPKSLNRIGLHLTAFLFVGLLFLFLKTTPAFANCSDPSATGCWFVTLNNNTGSTVTTISYSSNLQIGTYTDANDLFPTLSRQYRISSGTCVPGGPSITFTLTLITGAVVTRTGSGYNLPQGSYCNYSPTTVYVGGGSSTDPPPRPTDICGNGINEDFAWDSAADETCYPYNLSVTWICNSQTTLDVIFDWDSPASTDYLTIDGVRGGPYSNSQRPVHITQSQSTSHTWRVVAKHSGGTADYKDGPSYTLPPCMPDPPVLSFIYQCQLNTTRSGDANLSYASVGSRPQPDKYILYRSDALYGTYNQIGTDTNSTYTDSVTTTGLPLPPNYFYKVLGYYSWSQSQWGAWSNGNVGQGQPTNAPGASYDSTPTCGANYSVTSDVSSVNIPATYSADDRDFNITVPGNPQASNIQGNVRVYISKDQTSFNLADMVVCQDKPAAGFTIPSLPSGITFRCQNSSNPFSPLVSPLGGSMQVIVHTSNIAEVNLGDHKFRVFVCDNFLGNPIHYRLKYNNRTDNSITGIYDETTTDPANCHYSNSLNIHILTTPWIRITGGDVGGKSGALDFGNPPGTNKNLITTAGKMALISGGAITFDVPDTASNVWKLSSYSPSLNMGPFYDTLLGRAGTLLGCGACAGNGIPGDNDSTKDGVYTNTGGFTITTAKSEQSKVVIFIKKGNLIINADVTADPTKGVIFVVDGDVTINDGAKNITAAIIADGNITINGATAATQTLNFTGVMAAAGKITVNRDLPGDQDATSPAASFVYDSRYARFFASLIGSSSNTWQEVAP